MSERGTSRVALESQLSRTAEGHARELRRRLLDLRTSNRLIHFPHAERGRNYVRVVDEIPEALHRRLLDGRSLRVLPLPASLAEPLPVARRGGEPADALQGDGLELMDEPEPGDEPDPAELIAPDELSSELSTDLTDLDELERTLPAAERAARLLGIDPSFTLPTPDARTPRSDRNEALQTLLYPELHQKILANIADLTRSAQQEQGIHTLFAAFGFIEWYERADSYFPRFAPLVLQPLALSRERKPGTYEYAVSAHDEELEINHAFSERLARDFGFRLPGWEEDDELGSYLARVGALIAAQPRWKLHRWVTISNFSFARIAMYHDLDSERWPGGQAPHQHPTFRLLTSDRTEEPVTRFDDENEELPTLADELPSLVLDADTSQVAAVLEGMEPRHLVIKGPPGTGKSQTIANLIAAALHANQRVLFIAEKLAALEVVKARLDRTGLGAFCLELHSHRATRKAVMEALGLRLELKERVPGKLEAQRQRLRTLRVALNEYAWGLNVPAGALGYSVYELIWRRERARNALSTALPALEPLRVRGAPTLGLEELDRVRHGLRGLAQAAHDRERAFADDAQSIWFALERPELEEEPLLSAVEAYRAELQRICAVLRDRLPVGAQANLSPLQVRALCALAGELPQAVALPALLLERLDPERAHELFASLALLRTRNAIAEELARSCHAIAAAQAALSGLREASATLAAVAAVQAEREATTIATLHARAAAHVKDCEQLERGSERVARLMQFAGLGALEEPECVLILQAALAELNAAPRALLQALRSAPAVRDEAALPALSALKEEAAGLCRRRAASQQRLEPGRHDRELSERGVDHALALERPWWLAWLFTGFWAARRFYRRIARQPSRSPRQMAEELREAVRTLDAVAGFEARADAKRLAGQNFAGIDTDFELLVQAADWARRIRTEHAGLHPAAEGLRRLALEDELARVDALLAEARRQELEPFWVLASRAERVGQRLSVALEHERERAVAALAALELLVEVGIHGELPLGALNDVLAKLLQLSQVESELAASSSLCEQLGLSPDLREEQVEPLSAALYAFDQARAHGIAPTLVANLAEPEARSALASQLAGPLAGEQRAREALALLDLTEERVPVFSASLERCESALEQALRRRGLLRAQLSYLRELAREKQSFAGSLVEAAANGALPFDKLVEACEFLLFHELIERACEQNAALAQRKGRELESMRGQFQALDRALLSLQAKAIAAGLSSAEVPDGVASGKKSEWSELALIKHELSKKQRHVPLRQLLRRAEGALRALKPCFMMSPLTVAQFLPQLPDQFDVLIIDEASQMRPEEAMGALVRAKRAIVVGDPKQLPPTSFFQRLESADELDDDGDESRDEAIDQESILDLSLASFGAARDLRWHYRSRHPSLIAFSNRHFYDGRLKVFPAPCAERGESGVHLVKVDGEYNASLNPIEAEQIALGVVRHARTCKRASLGVVAMNRKQKELIEQKIYELGDEAVRAFVDAQNVAQPFFVKSLENVQGDERDVIFVSMTYGPDPKSKKVPQRFGPLNSHFGARRLNVLFTRARERLVVYSSLRPEDVRVDDATSPGLRTLRDYLAYAEHGLAAEQEQSAGALGAFEQAVCEVLEQAGYAVVPRVGVHGFFVDLAVRAPDGEGFSCGIECDGPEYQAQRSTRDRERLRQEVLESLGWKLVRVWSTDWFRAPRAARERLLANVRSHAGAPAQPDALEA